MQPLSDNLANVPAFLTKLWKMVSDSKTDHLIRWSPVCIFPSITEDKIFPVNIFVDINTNDFILDILLNDVLMKSLLFYWNYI